MKTKKETLILNGNSYGAKVDIFDQNDLPEINCIYNMWVNLSKKLNEYNCRKVNFPEISEILFCIFFDCWRVNSINIKDEHTSFDCYNPKNYKRIQIKSAGAESELTSFGPGSVWDELYFMDFFNDGNYDGTFKVYLIPNNLIYETVVNNKNNETFIDQQQQKRRPRFSIRKKIIKLYDIEPIGEFNIEDML